jgi:hypothetical protein
MQTRPFREILNTFTRLFTRMLHALQRAAGDTFRRGHRHIVYLSRAHFNPRAT